MQNFVIFGPPGSGKGTQSECIIKKYGLKHLSTGDLLRAEIELGSELGQEIARRIDDGNFVSDEMAQAMVKDFIYRNKDEKGFVFDGFPRTIPQCKWLDSLLAEINSEVSFMLSLKVDDAELTKRILKRSKYSQRPDDRNEVIIASRIAIYHKNTTKVMDFYKSQNKHFEIDGTGSLDEIFERICLLID